MSDLFAKNPHRIVLEENRQGRDFVVGDLHGCRSMLDDLLAQVAFDTTRDRLFSVGDLVDRGPDSAGCLRLLAEPWFHAVLGNHDAMFMAWVHGLTNSEHQYTYARSFEANDGWQWARRYPDADFAVSYLERLPFVIEVQGELPFRVVHAELTDAQSLTVAPELFDRDLHSIIGFGEGNWQDHCLWGRSLIKTHRKAQNEPELVIPLPGHRVPVYCGHTIVPEPTNFACHTFIDTGAYREGGKLTMIEPATGQFWFSENYSL